MSSRITIQTTKSYTDILMLSTLLDSFLLTLKTPYLERNTQKSSQCTHSDELKNAINEIFENEKNLEICIGIAKELIAKNDQVILQYNKLEKENSLLEFQSCNLQSELEWAEEKLKSLEEKYEQVNKELANSELEIIKLTSKLRKSEGPLMKVKIDSPANVKNKDQYEVEISELAAQCAQEHEMLVRVKVEAQQKSKLLEEENEKLKSQLCVSENDCSQLLKKNKNLSESLKKFEQEINFERKTRKEIEMELDKLVSEHQILRKHIEKQAEELEILQNLASGKEMETQDTDGETLQMELDALNDSFELNSPELQVMFIRQSMALSCLKNSFRAEAKNLGVFKQEPIYVNATQARKPPEEEYFFLLTQAIKRSSSYMEPIYDLSPSVLYNEAIKHKVPFHKWHVWVEKKLNEAYYKYTCSKILKQSHS